MSEICGKKNWIFCDGDLPPAGNQEPLGHEALMITNISGEQALLTFDLYFEDQAPVKGITAAVGAERVRCFRLDRPLGDRQYKIPFGQYSLVVHSTVPVAAVFGRLDVRQPNMAYYSVPGYSY